MKIIIINYNLTTIPCVNCDCYVWIYNDGEYSDNIIEYLEHKRLLCKNCFITIILS